MVPIGSQMLALQSTIVLIIEVFLYAWVGTSLAQSHEWSTFGLALWVLALGLAVRFAVVMTTYAISRAHARPRPPGNQLGVAKTITMLALEWWATTVVFSVLQPLERWLGLRNAKQAPDEGAPPILLIHGYICNGAYWWPLVRFLRARGIHALYTINLEPAYGSIDGCAAQISKRVNAILSERGAKQVILVAHSMGGLAARAYARTDEGAARVLRLITLATPHHGTLLALASPTRNAVEMRPRSTFLAGLDRADKPLRARMVAIFSEDDNVVFPQHSQALEGATNIAVSGVGHVAMSFSPKIQELVHAQLKSLDSEPAPRSRR